MEPKHIDPKQIVANGYDRIAEQYCAWASQVRQEERAKYTAVWLDTLPVGAARIGLWHRTPDHTTTRRAIYRDWRGSIGSAGGSRAAQRAYG